MTSKYSCHGFDLVNVSIWLLICTMAPSLTKIRLATAFFLTPAIPGLQRCQVLKYTENPLIFTYTTWLLRFKDEQESFFKRFCLLFHQKQFPELKRNYLELLNMT